MQDFNERLSEVDEKISEAKSSGGDQSEELREARATMKSLRDRKDTILRDRAEIAALQRSAKASIDSKISVRSVFSIFVQHLLGPMSWHRRGDRFDLSSNTHPLMRLIGGLWNWKKNNQRLLCP